MDHDTFMHRYLKGQVTAAQIDDAIDAWHSGTTKLPLPAFLGLTEAEYAGWVKEPSSLPDIASQRSNQR